MKTGLYLLAFVGCLAASAERVFCAPLPDRDIPTEIAASEGGTCIVVTGIVWCWGNNVCGELGAGTTDEEPHPVPRQVPGLSGVTGLWAASRSLCGLASGQLLCWGNYLPGSGPTPAPAAFPATGVIGPVAAGETHVCAQAAGRLHCWGKNDFSQLGTGDFDVRTSPAAVEPALDAQQIAATWDSTCALTAGKLVCWGSNRYGKLGKPVEIEIHGAPDETGSAALHDGVSQVVGACDSYCALKGGTVYCWGLNNTCSLGRATAEDNDPIPREVPGLPADIVRLVPGNGSCPSHVCALTAGGALWCWGSNDNGQIGQDPDAAPTSCTPVKIAGPLKDKKISLAGTGRSHTCAVTDEGLWCWGANDRGQLGRDTAGAATHVPGLAAAPWQRPARQTGTVKGKVTSQGKALAGAMVYLYRSPEGGFRGAADYQAGPTGPDGLFEATPEKGRYFVIAHRSSRGTGPEIVPGDDFAYYGGNPVSLGAGDAINLGINCSPVIDAGEKSAPGGTGLRGRVLQDGKPLERARVTLYQDGGSIFRGIGYASVLTDPGGEFSFNLDEGKYFVVARKRTGEDKMGPLGEGGFFGFAHDNPVEVRRDRYTVVAINTTAKLLKVKEGGGDITLGGTVKAGGTVIAGVVRDRLGKPVAGIFASAYRDPMMTQKPDFIAATGSDGSYAIDLSEGGEYFIGARNTMGGPPERGDLLGRYAGTEDHAVRVKTGERLEGIDIVVDVVE